MSCKLRIWQPLSQWLFTSLTYLNCKSVFCKRTTLKEYWVEILPKIRTSCFQKPIISNWLNFHSELFPVICFSWFYVAVYCKKWTDLLKSLLWIFTSDMKLLGWGAIRKRLEERVATMPYWKLVPWFRKKVSWVFLSMT